MRQFYMDLGPKVNDFIPNFGNDVCLKKFDKL